MDNLPEFCTLADMSEVLGISRTWRVPAGRTEADTLYPVRQADALLRGRLKQWVDQETEGKQVMARRSRGENHLAVGAFQCTS